MLNSIGVRALLVSSGIHAPDSRLTSVPAAEDSVKDLGQCLVDRAGLDPDHLTTLIDVTSPQQLSTALAQVASQAEDVLFFAYAGHGLVSPTNELHLATYATIDLNQGVPENQALPYSTVRNIIGRCRAKLIVIILDCCFSGRAEGLIGRNGDNPFDVTPQQGVYLLTSAGRDELAWAPPGRYTAFSGALIRLLRVGDPVAPPQLTLDDVYKSISRTLSTQGFPLPHRYAADHADAVPLATNPAYGACPSSGGFSPYRGLAPFGPEDAQYFFGREDLTSVLIDRLAQQLSTSRLLIVTGPSGSGKSSLLRAGFIPALGRMQLPTPGQSRPQHLFLTPGRDPLGNLVKRVAEATGTSLEDLRRRVTSDPGNFVAALQEARSVYTSKMGLRGQPFVVVVDQFEEVFAPDIHEADRDAFIKALGAACRQGDGKKSTALVVLGVRADFFGHCTTYPQLSEALEHPVIVGPMSEDQLRMVIVKPAELAGLRIEGGLIDLLLQDLETTGRPADGAGGVLPLLSHALLVTWQHRAGSLLTLAGYRAGGGIASSLAQTAEVTLGRLDLDSHQIARRLLLRLVHLGDGTEDTRRYVPLTELLPSPDNPEHAAARRVLDLFVHARLLTVDTNTVRITHEALIRAWPRFRKWINADRAALVARERLGQDASAWDRSGRESAFLYTGSRLAAAQAAAGDQHRLELTLLQRAFLDASIRRARRRARLNRQLLSILTALLVFTVGAGAVAFQQRQAADEQRDVALSRLVAEEAGRLRGTDVSLAMQLGLISYRISPTTEAFSSLMDTTTSLAATRILGPVGTEMNAVAFNPSGTILAAGSANSNVQLWTVSQAGHPVPLGQPLRVTSGGVTSVEFSPNGQILAAGSASNVVRLWNVSNPRRPDLIGQVLLRTSGTVNSIAFRPDGRILAAASSDGKVYLWNIVNPHHISLVGPQLNLGGAPVNSVAFSPRGTMFAAGDADGHVQLWNMNNILRGSWNSELLTGPVKAVRSVTFSPDGRTLASGGDDDNVWLWRVAGERPVPEGKPLTGPASWVYSVSFSRDGDTIAAGSADNNAYVWGLASRTLLATLPHPGPLLSVSYGPDSHILATGDADGVARMWILRSPVLTGFQGSVFTVSFSPDGRYLITGSGDGILRRWDVANPSQPIPLGPTMTANGLDGTAAYGPGGRIAAGAADGNIQLWNAEDPTHPVRLPSPASALASAIQYVTFDRSGHLMAAGDSTGSIELWNVTNLNRATPIAVLSASDAAPGNDVFAVTFSPDDHLLASADGDGTVRLWDIKNPRHPRQLGPPLTRLNSQVYQVAISPHGNILASSGEDGKVRLWDLAHPSHPRLLSILSGPIGIVYNVSFSPDGRRLATANGDKTVSLWDITNPIAPRSLGTLTGPSGTVFSVAFNPTGNSIAAGSQDNTTRLWLADPNRAASYICSVSGDSITRAEWARYVPGTPYNPPCGTSS